MAKVTERGAIESMRLIVNDKMNTAIDIIKAEAHLTTPAKPSSTGNLLNSLTQEYSEEKMVGTVGYKGVEYAPYVEFGTKKMSPRRFLQKAIDNSKPRLDELFGG